MRDLKLDSENHDALKSSLEQVRDKIDSILKILTQASAADSKFIRHIVVSMELMIALIAAKDAKRPKQLTKADMGASCLRSSVTVQAPLTLLNTYFQPNFCQSRQLLPKANRPRH